MGMSMGGLVARYALRDMEVRRANNPSLPAHDTRLYISHEAPHQGANVPLGFQYMVKSLNGLLLYPGATLGSVTPELASFAGLLNEPATQQLLIYQTDPNGTNLHTSWLSEYNQLGYPQQCRNVATSDGSQCGRPQSFAPGSNLLTIRGTGLLDNSYNGVINSVNFLLGTGTGVAAGGLLLLAGAGTGVGAIAMAVGYAVGVIFAMGNYEGNVDFVVNALPSQQQQSIYHGRFRVCKDIVFGLFTTCALNYADDNNSDSTMLPYDSAAGGIYDINQVSNGALNKISSSIPVAGVSSFVQPTFCFVPTTSALDIGGGNVALNAQDLTASYVNTTPPAALRNTPFANFITASRENLTHILWNGLNSKWAFQEMQQNPQDADCQSFCQANPTINVPGSICSGGTTFSINNLPARTDVAWSLNTSASVSATTGSGPTFTVSSSGGQSANGVLTATLTSECGIITISAPLFIGPPQSFTINGPTELDCNDYAETYYLSNYSANLSYTTRATGVLRAKPVVARVGSFQVLVSGPGTGSITVTASNSCGSVSNTVYVQVDQCSNYSVYPNPANDEAQIQQNSGNSSATRSSSMVAAPTSKATGIHAVLPYDSYGQVQLQQAGNGANSLLLKLSKLPVGSYIMHIVDGQGNINRQQFMIKR